MKTKYYILVMFLVNLYFGIYNAMYSAIDAIKSGNITQLIKLINNGVPGIFVDHKRRTLLHYAAKANKLEIAHLLLTVLPNIDDKDKFGNTPLHFACYYGADKIVELLIEAKATINSRNTGQNTPFHCACVTGRLNIAKVLLEKGVDANLINYEGQTPLMLAACEGHVGIVEYLIAKKANINAVDKENYTALHYAAFNNDIKIVNILINNNAKICVANNITQSTPLDFALNKHFYEIAKLLTNKIKCDFTIEVLLDYLKNNNIEQIIELLKKETKIILGFQNQNGETLLHFIISSQNESIIKSILVLTYGLSGVKNNSGQTPIMLAAQKGPEFLDIFMQIITPKKNKE